MDLSLIVKQLVLNFNLKLDDYLTVNDNTFYEQIISNYSLGFGESYMQGKWKPKIGLDELFYIIGQKNIHNKFRNLSWWLYLSYCKQILTHYIWNPQSLLKSKELVYSHYDLGNELFTEMLDPTMMYSCGYWLKATNLNEAQLDKMELICQKIKITPNMVILDIGCGWGGFEQYVVSKYHVHIKGITISKEQYDYCQTNNKYPNLVDYLLIDYRDLKQSQYQNSFDAVVSIGMFEHVGPLNYSEYMSIVNYVLKDNGLFLLHTIGGNSTRYLGDPWITKYIFKSSVVPSLTGIAKASENLMIIEDVHNFGAYYDKTLMQWYKNFTSQFQVIQAKRITNGKPILDDTFYRMWEYYLLSCAGMFRSRQLQLYQVVLSKGINGVYQRPTIY